MSVIGIDIGSSHCVMATVARGSVHIIRNELSERKTASLVSYTDDRRLIGDHAQTQLFSNYKNTCRGIKNLLGLLYDDISINDATSYSLCPINSSENGLAGYSVTFKGKQQVISATRVMAALLSHLVRVADNFLGRKSSEVVISCPSWFTDIHRSALLAAAEIAGINCLRIFSEHIATALDYGIFRMAYFSESQSIKVAFVAVGHSNTSVSIVEFTKEKLKVLSEANDKMLGGKDMDLLIVKYFASKFNTKTGLDCLQSIKHKLKLEEQASKIKTILSANSEAFCNLECFMEDHDINDSITRDQFTELCQVKLASRLQSVIEKAFSSSGLSLEELNSVELVGGCTRIPWVIELVQNYFEKVPSRTLSSDECVARGCALQAAMVSVHYRVTDYGCQETLNHTIFLTWATIPAIPKQFQNNPANAFSNFKTEVLMSKGVVTNKKQKFHFQCEGPIFAYVHYSEPQGLPDGTPIELGECLVIPPSGTTDVYLDVGLNFHGQFKFLSAYTMKKQEILESEQNNESSVQTSENIESSVSSDTAQKDENMNEKKNESPKPVIKYIKEEISMKVQVYKGKYSHDEIAQYKQLEVSLYNQDLLNEKRLSKMNSLEAFILNFRNRLSQDLKDFCSESEKDSILSLLDNCEDWVYDNYQADITTIENKLEEVSSSTKVILERFNKFNEIHYESSQLLLIYTKCHEYTLDTEGLYSHIPLQKKQNLEQATSEINNFLTNMKIIDPLSPDDNLLNQIKIHKAYLTNLQKEFLETPKPAHPVTEENEVITSETNQEKESQSEKDLEDSN